MNNSVLYLIQLVDANQRWEVQEAIDWMKELADCKITWIEEPTSPDDILGHQQIAKVTCVTESDMGVHQLIFSQNS